MSALPVELQGCTPINRDFGIGDLLQVKEHDNAALQPRGNVTRRCRTKQAYGRRRAHRAARILIENQGEDVHAYSCEDCGRWHVGHKPAAW